MGLVSAGAAYSTGAAEVGLGKWLPRAERSSSHPEFNSRISYLTLNYSRSAVVPSWFLGLPLGVIMLNEPSGLVERLGAY